MYGIIQDSNQGKGAILLIMLVFSVIPLFSVANHQDPQIKIPKHLPEGFNMSRGPNFYGTYEKPRENGTIYDFINGGGEVYIRHGFTAVAHMELMDGHKNLITVNIFQMNSPEAALSGFQDKAICPDGYKMSDKEYPMKLYHFEPDYMVRMVKGRYLVYLAVSNDTLKEALIGFADDVYKVL